MRQDLRFAMRMISSNRWFSAAVLVTLALGIGVNTMVFTLIDAVLFKPVPVPGGERLVTILVRDLNATQRDRRRMPVSWPDFVDYQSHGTSLEALEAGSGDGAILSEKGIAPQHYSMFRVSSGFFGMLHVRPVRGRDFAVGDDKPGAAPVVLLGFGVWKQRYGGGDVLGRFVRVNGKPASIVGVMPEGFRFPSEQDLWMPLQAGADLQDRSHRPLQLFGILKPGVTIMQADAEFGVISRRLAREYPKDDKDTAALVQTFHQRYNGDEIQMVFSLLMAAVGLILLIACANVANMMLGRALARGREISIRAAMGASRWQIVRQLLVESLLLSVVGGTVGLGLSALGVHGFDLATQDVGKPYWVQFTMDYRVFVYFSVVCVLSTVLFGLVPALRSSGANVNTALKDGTRSAGTRHGGRLSSLLVVVQFALTLVLLLGAGVFMRSFVDKQSVNRWIPGDQLMTARINLPEERYKDASSRRRFFEKLLPRVAAIPGVSGVAISSDLPGTGSGKRRIEIEDTPLPDKDRGPSASVEVQSPGYFAAINLPILRGRDFVEADGLPGQLHAIVTREFAGRHWGNQDTVGKRFRFYVNKKAGEWISVVGVSGDIVQNPIEPTSDPLLFLPYSQDSYDSMALLVRTASPSAAAPTVRDIVQKLDLDLPLFELRTMTEVTARQIWFLQLFGTIFLVFAAIALVMASVGIYAVMAQATGSRTREIGVRMALGATPRSIAGLVLTRGVWQLIAGLGVGAAVSVPATRAMGSLRFLDAPSDPMMLASAGAVLSLVGLFACWLPARRAAALNPVNAIRNE
jgi:putative ABC transport system permease protein